MAYVRIADRVTFASEKMQKISLFDSDHMFCDVYCLEPGQSQKVHSHAGADKIYAVLAGTGRFTVGNTTHDLGPGHVIHAAAGEDHGVENASCERLELLVMMAPNPNRP